jgi:hypothetical protein
VGCGAVHSPGLATLGYLRKTTPFQAHGRPVPRNDFVWESLEIDLRPQHVVSHSRPWRSAIERLSVTVGSSHSSFTLPWRAGRDAALPGAYASRPEEPFFNFILRGGKGPTRSGNIYIRHSHKQLYIQHFYNNTRTRRSCIIVWPWRSASECLCATAGPLDKPPMFFLGEAAKIQRASSPPASTPRELGQRFYTTTVVVVQRYRAPMHHGHHRSRPMGSLSEEHSR